MPPSSMSVHLSSLSIVLPCFNEEANVERVVRVAVEVGRTVTGDLEVVVVDDGSSDGTRARAAALAEELGEVRVVGHETNVGYGGALRTGFLSATREHVFYTDGDGQFDLGELPRVLALLSRYSIVSCYRLDRRDGALRGLNGWAWTQLVNATLGLSLRDVNCAFKVYPRSLFDRIQMTSDGALIDAEILVQAQDLGYSIGQTGVRHRPREHGVQTGAQVRVIRRAMAELATLVRRRALVPEAVGTI